MLSLIYNDKEINDDPNVVIAAARYLDHACGKSDEVQLLFSNVRKLWQVWEPRKGDKITLSDGTITSSTMYISDCGVQGGKFAISALSAPVEAFQVSTQAWERVSLTAILRDAARKAGLEIQLIGVPRLSYGRMERMEESAIGFLRRLCEMESLGLKVYDGRAVVYEEKKLEAADPVATLTPENIIGEASFSTSDTGLIHSLTYAWIGKSGRLSGTAKSQSEGKSLTVTCRGSSSGELQRWAKGAIRSANKHEYAGAVRVHTNLGITAGSNVTVEGYGSFDGPWFVDSAENDLLKGESLLKLRGYPDV